MAEDVLAPASAEFQIETLGQVQLWRMNAPPVNALSVSLLDALDRALTAACADDSVAVVVLVSELRVFSAGADASWMARTVADLGPSALLEIFNRQMDRFRSICLSMRRSPFLSIAVIEGHCLAGGLELAAACDLRFCSSRPGIQIGAPEMDLFGVMPAGGGGSQFLARLMGAANALDFILAAKPVTPDRALQLGIVQRVCEETTVRQDAVSYAGEIAAKAGRIGVCAAKRAIFEGLDQPLASAMVLDHAVHWDSMRRGNFLTGLGDFTARFGRGSSA